MLSTVGSCLLEAPPAKEGPPWQPPPHLTPPGGREGAGKGQDPAFPGTKYFSHPGSAFLLNFGTLGYLKSSQEMLWKQ